VQLAPQRRVAAPIELVVHDDGFGHEGCAVAVVTLEVVTTHRVGKDRRLPRDIAGDGARVRIDEQLCGIAPVSLRRVPRPVDAEAVPLARPDVGQVEMPAMRCPFRQVHARRRPPRLVEQAQLDPFSDL
jgi:hypothetical protein